MGDSMAEQEAEDFEIDFQDKLCSQLEQLHLNERYADVTFIVENRRLHANRVILAVRSEYFRALLFGGLAESTQREIKLDVPFVAFNLLLRYVYTGKMSLSGLEQDCIIDVLALANEYGFQEIEAAISNYFQSILTLNNVCSFLDTACLYNLHDLSKACLDLIDRNALKILHHKSFLSLSKTAVEMILKRDTFYTPEKSIFLGVMNWCNANAECDASSVIQSVRYSLMTIDDILFCVRPTKLMSPDLLLDAIKDIKSCKDLPYRAALCKNVNVATPKLNSRVISGECRDCLLNNDLSEYSLELGFAHHTISGEDDLGIIVELGQIFFINHIKMLLLDLDSRSYSYMVFVSVNCVDWELVVDYRNYHCRSGQLLYFSARPTRYVRVVGRYNTANMGFHLVTLEAMYTDDCPALQKDVIKPTKNVATLLMNASVIDGVSRIRNCLIDGDYENYDWEIGYTCHQIGSGEIVVRLSQPYVIGSMRLLLWDLDDRTYSYYVETSTNQKDWTRVVDKRFEEARSWQDLSFEPLSMVFIRIVGTRNTANEIFHCVHFECPSEKLEQSSAVSDDDLSDKIGVLHDSSAQCNRPVDLRP